MIHWFDFAKADEMTTLRQAKCPLVLEIKLAFNISDFQKWALLRYREIW